MDIWLQKSIFDLFLSISQNPLICERFCLNGLCVPPLAGQRSTSHAQPKMRLENIRCAPKPDQISSEYSPQDNILSLLYCFCICFRAFLNPLSDAKNPANIDGTKAAGATDPS